MEPDMPIQNLRHQGVERTPASGDRVQDFLTIRFPLDRSLDGLKLAADPADAIEHFPLVTNNVSQRLPRQLKIVYPTRYTRAKAI